MTKIEPLQRRILARRNSQSLVLTGVALEMAMSGLMVTLLIVVMLAVGSQPHHSSFPLDFTPTAHAVPLPGATREDAIRVLLTRGGAIYVSNGGGYLATQLADLADGVREKLRAGAERRAYLAVDQRTHYGDVKTVVDAIRDGGVWNVSLVSGFHRPLK